MGTQGDSWGLRGGLVGLRELQGIERALMGTQRNSRGLRGGLWELRGTPGELEGAYWDSKDFWGL